MTYDELAALALAHEDVVETADARGAYLHRGEGWMLTLKRDGDTVAIKLDWSTHDRLLATHPGALFKTPHYDGYPALLARLDALTPGLAGELVHASWADAPSKARKRSPGV